MTLCTQCWPRDKRSNVEYDLKLMLNTIYENFNIVCFYSWMLLNDPEWSWHNVNRQARIHALWYSDRYTVSVSHYTVQCMQYDTIVYVLVCYAIGVLRAYDYIYIQARSQGAGRWGTCSITSDLCPITRPWAPSVGYYWPPSPILIHVLWVFN